MLRARVITCSDSAFQGERADESGPAVRDLLIRHGFFVDDVVVIPDEEAALEASLLQTIDRDGIDLVITTGGTGIAPRDVAPEVTIRVAPRVIPGFGELMRLRSLEKTPMAPLSRAQASCRGTSLVINVPGNPRGAVENLEAVLHLIPHALELLGGKRIQRHPSA